MNGRDVVENVTKTKMRGMNEKGIVGQKWDTVISKDRKTG